MADKKNILIVGGSYAGLSAAHYFLKHVLPALPEGGKGYHVTLANASHEWFSSPAAVRAIISEEAVSLKQAMLPIADGFKAYPAETFTFLVGKAKSVNAGDRSVTFSLKSGGEQTVSYYALIIATGAAPLSPLWGPHDSTDDVRTALEAFRARLPTAKNIVIGGGGPVAVESAGEMGEYLNGRAGFFASRPKSPKAKITILAGADKLLPVLNAGVAKKAEGLLNKVGVDVVYNARVQRTEPADAGTTPATVVGKEGQTTKVFLANGETLEADLYVAAMGRTPNTSWVPPEWLNDKRQVHTDPKTLRVEAGGAGGRVYAIGDVADYTRGGVMDIYNTIPTLLHNVKRDLLAADGSAQPEGEDRAYEDKLKETQLVPVGRAKGVGELFGWSLPSMMVYMIKGKDLFVSTMPELVNGDKWAKAS